MFSYQSWLTKLMPGKGSKYIGQWLGCSSCKILPKEERPGTLLPEITHPNNLRPTMETRQRRKKVIDVDSETLRLDNISKATGEESKAIMSTASADDGKKPDHVKKGKMAPG